MNGFQRGKAVSTAGTPRNSNECGKAASRLVDQTLAASAIGLFRSAPVRLSNTLNNKPRWRLVPHG